MSVVGERDLRDAYRDVPWQQGSLLDTPFTRRLSAVERQLMDQAEKRRLFVSYTFADFGHSRIFLCEFSTPEECAHAVQAQLLRLYFR